MDTDSVSCRAPAEAGGALDEAVLAELLVGLAVDWECVVETGSTSSDLLARARTAAPPRPLLRVAQRQTQGRGRRGRPWHGAERGSLLFSLALPWHRGPADSSAVTLACGLAVAAAVQEQLPMAPGGVRVKWPNDILLDGGKLAGILVELAEDASGARSLVVGLGINLASDAALRARVAGAGTTAAPDGALHPLSAPPATAAPAAVAVADLATRLGAHAVLTQREAWLARLVRALLEAARRFERAGFADGPAAFAARCAYLGETVEVHGAGPAPLAGALRGVDSQGRLLLETAQGVQALNNGEVSVRAQDCLRGAP